MGEVLIIGHGAILRILPQKEGAVDLVLLKPGGVECSGEMSSIDIIFFQLI
jgi:hypothetical protein